MRRQLITPSDAIARTTRLSRIDGMLSTMVPRIAFCYAERLDAQALALALARVLNEYSAYAGRLCPQGAALWLKHGVGGAAFETMASPASIDELHARASQGAMDEVCPRISALRASLGKEPLLAVRISQARDGTVIGLTWHHPVGDMHSTMLLLRAWSLAYRGLPYDPPFEVPDRDAYLTERLPDPQSAVSNAILLPASEWITMLMRLAIQRTRRVSFELSAKALDALTREASAGRSVSRNDALCAHVCSAIRQLNNQSDVSTLTLTVNYRKRVGLPDSMLGNALCMLPQAVERSDGLPEIAAQLRGRLDEFATKHIDYGATLRFAQQHSSFWERTRLWMRGYEPQRGNLFVSNWTGFGIYDLTFGTGQPRYVCCLATDSTWFATVHESPRTGSVAFAVTLPRALADRVNGSEGRALLYPGASDSEYTPAAAPA